MKKNLFKCMIADTARAFGKESPKKPMRRSYRKVMDHCLKIFLVWTTSSGMSLLGQTQQVPMADAFRAEGKIYVVLTCVILLWLGFMWYLWRVARKLGRLEKNIEAPTSIGTDMHTEEKYEHTIEKDG